MQTDKTHTKTVARKPAAAARKAVVPRVPRPLGNGAAAAVATAAADKPNKDKKIKLVRDSISIPKNEYQVLAELKLRAGKLAAPVKKTELIRAGIKALAAMPNAAFLAAVRAVPSLKTGRPPKSD
jgi:hypothetical protein